MREEINEYVGHLVTTADQVDALRAEVYAWADEDDAMGELVLACLDTASVLRDLVADAFSKKEKEIAQEVKALVEGCRLRDWGVDEVREHAGTKHPDARQIRRAFTKNPLWKIEAGSYNDTLETLRMRTHYATPEDAVAGWGRFRGRGYDPHVVEVEVETGSTTHHLVYASAEEAERDPEGLSPDATIVPMIANKEA